MLESEEISTISLTKQQYSVYSCLCYFHVFKYPLKKEDVEQFIDLSLHHDQISAILDELLELELVYHIDGYYFLEAEFSQYIRRRLSSEKNFLQKVKTIKRFATLVSRFPFVESVAVSGSCSKGLLDQDGDVDYFVIATPGRLWLCRTILILFKKIFLFNSKKYFCLNYFVDSNTLEIPDHNIFVASEIKTLAPISNKALFDRFLKANDWASNYLPNKNTYSSTFLNPRKPTKVAFRLIELLFANKLGNLFETWCYGLTYNTWRRRFSGLNGADFELNFRSRRTVSKHHPRGFQKKVLFELEKNLDRIRVLA
jgi:hypothetical protein